MPVPEIVRVIRHYLPLEPASDTRFFLAQCPFHSERTPSFVVDPHQQRFHCFGCGVGGDAVAFVARYDHLLPAAARAKIAALEETPDAP